MTFLLAAILRYDPKPEWTFWGWVIVGVILGLIYLVLQLMKGLSYLRQQWFGGPAAASPPAPATPQNVTSSQQ